MVGVWPTRDVQVHHSVDYHEMVVSRRPRDARPHYLCARLIFAREYIKGCSTHALQIARKTCFRIVSIVCLVSGADLVVPCDRPFDHELAFR